MMNIDDMSTLIIFAGAGIVLILLFAYLYMKDQDIEKKFYAHEQAIDDIYRQIHSLQKKIADIDVQFRAEKAETQIKIQAQIQAKTNIAVEKGVKNLENDLYVKLKDIEESFEYYKNNIDNKIVILEEKQKELGFFPTGTSVDENKIIALYKDGQNVDSISRNLRVSKGEVEFTLKLANII